MTDATEAPADLPAPAPESKEPARVSFTLDVGPLSTVVGDLPTVVAEFSLSLVQLFYPSTIARKANVVVTELVQNIVENVPFPGSDGSVRLSIDGKDLVISVSNQVTDEQYAKVRAKIDSLGTPAEAKKLLAATIRERRPQRLKGGLGLIRLVAENRFVLAAERADGKLTVTARYTLEG
jgi:hypothetical protein